jgi:hypothetical protein
MESAQKMSKNEISEIHDFIVRCLKEGLDERTIKWKTFEKFPLGFFTPDELILYIRQVKHAKVLRA